MRKTIAKLLQKKGYSLIEVAVSIALVGVSSYFLANFFTQYGKNVQKVVADVEISNLQKDLLSDSKRWFTQGGSNGFCALINDETNSISTGAVVPIRFDLSSSKLNALDWSAGNYFSRWTMLNSACAVDNSLDGASGICKFFVKNASNASSQEIVAKKEILQAKIELIPVKINLASANGDMQNIALEQVVNSSEAGFRIRAIFRYKINDQTIVSRDEDFVWAGNADSCANSTGVPISMTGIGPGESTSNYIYANRLFSSDIEAIDNEPVAPPPSSDSIIQMAKIHMFGGEEITTASGAHGFQTDVDKLESFACNDMEYRPPSVSSANRIYRDFRALATVIHSPALGKSKCLPSHVNVCKGSSCILSAATNPGVSVGFLKMPQDVTNQFDFSPTGNAFQNGAENIEDFANNTLNFFLYIDDNGAIRNRSVSQGNNICRAACAGYDKESNFYKAGICYNVYAASGGTVRRECSETHRVACSACFMKACGTLAIDTWGHLDDLDQHPEPLDGIVPEYTVGEASESDYLSAGSQLFSKQTTAGCLTARFDGSKIISINRVDCGQNKKSLCFYHGKFRVLSATSAFQNSSTLCYEQGQITPSSGSSIYDEMLATFQELTGPLPSGDMVAVASGKIDIPGLNIANPSLAQIKSTLNAACLVHDNSSGFNKNLSSVQNHINSSAISPCAANTPFMNLSGMGIFISPATGQNDNENIFGNKGVASDNFWINLVADGQGYIYAPPPAWKGSGAHLFAFYYDIFSRPHMRYYNPEWASHIDSTSNMYVLAHDLGHVGVVPVRNDNAAFETLCFDPNSKQYKIINTTSTDNTDADLRCRNDDKLFLPPISSLAWQKNMLEISENMDEYAFPNPSSAIQPLPARVNITSGNPAPYWKMSNTSLIDKIDGHSNKSWKLMRLTNIFNNDLFFIEITTTSGVNSVCKFTEGVDAVYNNAAVPPTLITPAQNAKGEKNSNASGAIYVACSKQTTGEIYFNEVPAADRYACALSGSADPDTPMNECQMSASPNFAAPASYCASGDSFVNFSQIRNDSNFALQVMWMQKIFSANGSL